jgi:hypothetical protein
VKTIFMLSTKGALDRAAIITFMFIEELNASGALELVSVCHIDP